MITNRYPATLLYFLCLFTFTLFISPYSKADTSNSISSSNLLQRINDRGTLIVGIDIPYGIMEFYDSEGKASGIDVDIVTEFSRQLGVKLEIKAMAFDKLFEAIHEGQVDIVASAVTITEERQKTLLFSVPYLDAGMSLAVRADNQTISTLSDLSGKKVAVLKGTVGEKLANKSELFSQSVISSYEINEKRMQDLQSGHIDAAIVHFLVTEEKTIRLVGEPLSQSFYGIVTGLNQKPLMNELNKILRDMKRSGLLISIKQRYADIKK